MDKISGIYKITINNKIYIGSAVNLKKREREHRNLLNKNKHPNPHLQHLYNKYKYLEFNIIELTEISNLHTFEQKYIDNLNPEINICKEVCFSRRGVKMTIEQRKKMSDNRIGIKFTKEHSKNISIGKLKANKIYTKEEKEKISKGNKGKIISEKNKK